MSLSSSPKYSDSSIDGYECFLREEEPDQSSVSRSGMMNFAPWLIMGAEEALRDFTQANSNTLKIHEKAVRQQMKDVVRAFSHSTDPSFVLVSWPDYWITFYHGGIIDDIQSRTDLSTDEKKAAVRNLDAYVFKKAESKQQLVQQIWLKAGKLAAETLGSWTVVGSDCGNGFRVSGSQMSPKENGEK